MRIHNDCEADESRRPKPNLRIERPDKCRSTFRQLQSYEDEDEAVEKGNSIISPDCGPGPERDSARCWPSELRAVLLREPVN